MQLTSHGTPLEPLDGRMPMRAQTAELRALAQFYHGFNNRDLALLEENWIPSDDVSMADPLGGIARGWDEVRAVYQRIFNRSTRVELELCDFTLHIVGSVFYAIGREVGSVRSGDRNLSLDLRTTRIFKLDVGRWRQAHHHGSMENPELLRAYQELLR